MKFSLYDLSDEIIKLDILLNDLGGDVSEGSKGQELAQRLESAYEMVENKIDGIVRYAKSLEAHTEAVKAEYERLNKIKRFNENKIKRLKDMVKTVCHRLGRDELRGEVFSVKECKSGGKEPLKLIVEDISKYPSKYVKTEIVSTIDKEAVKKGLSEKDPDLDGLAEIQEKSTYIKFK